MKTQSKYSLTELYKLQKIQHEIQDLREKILAIDQEVREIRQSSPHLEPEKAKTYSQEYLHDNNSKTEVLGENVEQSWGNYILVVLIVLYFVAMSFL